MTLGVMIYGIATIVKKKNLWRKRLLEVGARNVNGSLRPFTRIFLPRTYIGVDIEPGWGVDEICDATKLLSRFKAGSFDGVICTEMIEHVENYRLAVDNMKAMVGAGGWMFLSAPGPGFPKHDYPSDYHRFTPQDLVGLFTDWNVEAYAKTIENESCVFARRD